MRTAWTKKAREHALKLRGGRLSDAEIGAMMGRSTKSVSHALAGLGGTKPRKPRSRYREHYNRIEVSSLLGITLDDFMRHQIELEEGHGMPRSTRPKYSVPRLAFDRWLKKREYPNLTPRDFVEQARAAFLRACFNRRPDKEITNAARILAVAENILAQTDG